MPRILLALLLALAVAAPALAQTVIAVDINKAKLLWDAGVGGGVPTEYRVKCGTTTGVYSKTTLVAFPTREVTVKAAIAGEGNWFCVVTAANAIGESGPSNEVAFLAGTPPSVPVNLRLQAQ